MMLRKLLIALALAITVVPAFDSATFSTAIASDIRYSVNGQAITSTDIARRTNFLKVQGVKGGSAKAADEMIDQALKLQAGEQAGIRVSTAEVDAAYERFAKSNKMSPKQMNEALNQIGVTSKHFKEYIRTSITWGQVMQMRARGSNADGSASIQDVVANMLQKGGSKPTSTEYILQQVIFVVPTGERGAKLNARKREAEQLRARFQSCDTTIDFAKGLVDVTVRDLGRVLEAELPDDWKDQIVKVKQGGATGVRTTERGAEFIAVCRSRAVSDDKVAELQFRLDAVKGGGEAEEEALAELRKNAQIVKR
jgi:peptidyl-prolyl cis-trans isomerase SurA